MQLTIDLARRTPAARLKALPDQSRGARLAKLLELMRYWRRVRLAAFRSLR